MMRAGEANPFKHRSSTLASGASGVQGGTMICCWGVAQWLHVARAGRRPERLTARSGLLFRIALALLCLAPALGGGPLPTDPRVLASDSVRLPAQGTPRTQADQASQPTPLAVMSFNIRYGTAMDGDNQWHERRDLLFDVMREQDADLVGLQEALDFQIDEIVAALPAYAVVGIGRDDGARKGEYAAILFRKDRLHVAASGTFWFSATPDVVRSATWGNRVTRICTWARFVDRDGRPFWVYNVHLDHESQPSREKSVALLRERIDARPFPGEPVIVTGDFNVGEANPALRALTSGGAFVDTFRVRYPDEKQVGTFTGFRHEQVDGDKIDYVFAQPGAQVLSAAIVRTSRDGRYPSDHFPVVARILLER
jgi:endonuclease/exonuclease/phosphatase family metal-dependent hydrolase